MKKMKLIFEYISIFEDFILEYIGGKFGMDTVINAIILKLSNLDLIQIIGFSF